MFPMTALLGSAVVAAAARHYEAMYRAAAAAESRRFLDAQRAQAMHASLPAVKCEYCASVHRAERCGSCGAPRRELPGPAGAAGVDVRLLYGWMPVRPDMAVRIIAG